MGKIEYVSIERDKRPLYRLKSFVFTNWGYETWRDLDGVYVVVEEKTEKVDIAPKDNNLMPWEEQETHYVPCKDVIIQNIRTKKKRKLDKRNFKFLFEQMEGLENGWVYSRNKHFDRWDNIPLRRDIIKE